MCRVILLHFGRNWIGTKNKWQLVGCFQIYEFSREEFQESLKNTNPKPGIG